MIEWVESIGCVYSCNMKNFDVELKVVMSSDGLRFSRVDNYKAGEEETDNKQDSNDDNNINE